MNYPSGLDVTLVVRTESGRDAYNNPDYAESRTTVRGCPVWPDTSTEAVTESTSNVTVLVVILPAKTDVGSIDAIEIHGLSYEVQGVPFDYVSPLTGWAPGVPVKVRRAS